MLILPSRQRGRPRTTGFTLVELMVTIALVALMLRLALPAFSTMLRNTQVRSVAEALQNGLRSAQSEALRRNRQVVFSLTNGTPALNTAATADGANWQAHTVARTSGDGATRTFLQGGALSDVASGATIDAADAANNDVTAVCFNSNGRLVVNAAPGVSGASCSAMTARYDVSMDGADLKLRVELGANGRVRMCNRARTFSSSTPDGCST